MLDKIKEIHNVAIYIRLSKGDIGKGDDDSESVKNQRFFLEEFVRHKDWKYKLVDIYVDDGFTGTNFNRPEFQRMISDVNDKKINTIVVKDLSRLGRNYTGTGQYLDEWFPEHKVRLIAVNDGVDTFLDNGANDIAPFKSVMDEMYSKDLSKKIRTAMYTMQKQGKWVGAKAALGYIKDPENKNHLIVCDNEAEIIKLIFNMAYTGSTLGQIRKYLNENHIPTFSMLRNNRATFWENKAIKNILTNEVYIGTSSQNKRNRFSYKIRKQILNSREDWVIVENTHEPIIEKNVFDAVQKMVIVQNYTRNEKKNTFLLDGLLICYECKHKIGVRVGRTKKYSMVCNNYRRNSKLGICTSHGFNYDDLEKTVIDCIKKLFKTINDGKIESNIKENMSKYDYGKMLEKLETEIKLINDNIDKMYIDKLEGKVSEDMYNRLFEKLTEDISNKQKEYAELKNKKENTKEEDAEKLKNTIKEFLKLSEPTPEIMRTIINRIEVHQDKQIDIIFNFKKLNNLNCLN